MFTYFSALSDVAMAIEAYRKEHPGITTDQGQILNDMLLLVNRLAGEEHGRLDEWLDFIHEEESMTRSYGGTE